MSLRTNLCGRLRNTHLPKNKALLPLFEAVVNSIHAIEDMENWDQWGKITVHIERIDQKEFPSLENRHPGREACPEISSFVIIDNGVGFTDENMNSFETLDSDYKEAKGCRGIGRLMWLKAFSKVSIHSFFENDTKILTSRAFDFTARDGITEPSQKIASHTVQRGTILELKEFKEEYRRASPKQTDIIAKNLLEHCLWYFIRSQGCPEIEIIDSETRLQLDDLYDSYMCDTAVPESISLKGQLFDLTHVKIRSSLLPPTIALCAGERLVKEEKLQGKIPGLQGTLQDEKGTYSYICYVTSDFLDKHVRADRTGFDIIEKKLSDLLEDVNDISLEEIQQAVLDHSKIFLNESLKENENRIESRLRDFVDHRAPRYKSILNRVFLQGACIAPDAPDNEIEIFLHRHLTSLEEELIEGGRTIMQPQAQEGVENYQKRVSEYLQKASDIKQSDLANYVAHRRVILDILRQAVQLQADGKYVREEFVHELLMPMQKTSEEVIWDECNLWVIDERLSFHNFLASDKTLHSMPISSTNSAKEPDILALQMFENPILVSDTPQPPLAAITVIEFKRPMRNDANNDEKDPIFQTLGYLEKIRKGRISTAKGRMIPSSETIPGYCYIICDTLATMETRRKLHQLKITSDGLGYFGFNPEYNAYIEVISYDRLINGATERNKAFFDRLGLPSA